MPRFHGYFIIILITCLTVQLFSQSRQDSLQEFTRVKHDITYKGMNVLGAWGIVNLGTGIYGALNTQGASQYFHQMNAFWGGVNMFIAYTGLRSLKKEEYGPVLLMRAELDQKKIKRLFLVNAGLDVLYIGSGIVLNEFAKNQTTNKDRFVGYGNSLVVQGAFLLGFDLTMYFIHKSNGKKRLKPLLEGFSFYGNGLIYRFG